MGQYCDDCGDRLHFGEHESSKREKRCRAKREVREAVEEATDAVRAEAQESEERVVAAAIFAVEWPRMMADQFSYRSPVPAPTAEHLRADNAGRRRGAARRLRVARERGAGVRVGGG